MRGAFDARGILALRGSLFLVHAFFEAFDTLAEIAHHFGDATPPEQDEDDEGDNDELPWTERHLSTFC